MAIDAYVGKPGHGKSYGVTEHVVIPSIKEGRHVVTNIPLECDDLLADFGTAGSQITQLPEDWHIRSDMASFCPPGCVLILDELWRRWPSGLKANQASLEDKALLAEHRHRVDDKGRSMRIVLVSQDLSQLAAWVRILIEQTYRMTKLTAVGSTKKFRVDIYMGAPTGDSPPKSKLIRQTYGQYKKEIYKYYQSATQSATGSVGDESKADQRGSIWRSWSIWLILGFGVLGPLLGARMLWGLYSSWASPSPAVEQAPMPAPARSAEEARLRAIPAPPVPDAPRASPPPPAVSSSWRVVGYLKRKGEGVPEDAPAWPSQRGYGVPPDLAQDSTRWLDDLAVLRNLSGGLRYVPLSDCEPYPNSPHYHCLVDGEKVTPWSGHTAFAQAFPTSTGAAVGQATNGTIKP